MMWSIAATLCVAAAAVMCAKPAATVPEILNVTLEKVEDGSYTFHVTVHHDDTGWDHYADWWVVENSDGGIIVKRTLRHPHVEEQPFTRALTGVRIPPGTDHLLVRAHCSRHGYGKRFSVSLNP